MDRWFRWLPLALAIVGIVVAAVNGASYFVIVLAGILGLGYGVLQRRLVVWTRTRRKGL